MSKRGSNSELFAHENDALPLGHSSTNEQMNVLISLAEF